jgi:glutamate-1-semialdehyde aminotransferase
MNLWRNLLPALFLFSGLASANSAIPTPLTCDERFSQIGETTNGFSYEEVLTGLLSLKTHGKLRSLSSDLIDDLMRLGKVNAKEDLLNPNVQNQILQYLSTSKKFEKNIGENALALKSALKEADSPKSSRHRNSVDLRRGWGWQLLEDSDPAFNDPKYLANTLKSSGASGEVFDLRSSTEALDNFSDAWKRAAPENVAPPRRFSLTGTDANNSLYEIAEEVVKNKKNSWNYRNLSGPAEIITFDGSYGGANGKIAKIGMLGHNKNKDLIIESPDTIFWNPTDPKEIARLEKIEKKSLENIRKKFTQDKPAIGGFLLEPILGAKGVKYYRPEFLQKLRALCDEFEVPIFADEILNGGGRTGKFFSYQHYEGFEPDFVSFGKGLQVAGVAKVNRKNAPSNLKYLQSNPGIVTLKHYEEPLNKGAQVLHRIVDGNLMKNAEENGNYFQSKLRTYLLEKERNPISEMLSSYESKLKLEINELEKMKTLNTQNREDLIAYKNHWTKTYGDRIKRLKNDIKMMQKDLTNLSKNEVGQVRGKGMLLHLDGMLPVPTAMGRILPPISLTKKQIDDLFIEWEKPMVYGRD